jgi:hypothetical protein
VDKYTKKVISPSGKYKATITEQKNVYSIAVFKLNESLKPSWSNVNSICISISDGLHPVAIAIEELRKLIGNPAIPLTIEWIKDFSFCNDATFIDPKGVNVYCDFIDQVCQERKLNKIEVHQIIKFDELCLVEEIGDEDDWQMGQIDSKGDIYCWGYYGTLKDAIKAL